MTISLDGPSKKHFRKLTSGQLIAATRRGVRQGMFMVGKDLSKYAKAEIMKPKNGKVYRIRIKGRKRTHTASAPGEYPARLTGALRRSVDFRIPSALNLEFGAGNDDVDYAGFLERGTRKMRPRPYLRPTIEARDAKTRTTMARRIKWALDQEMRG